MRAPTMRKCMWRVFHCGSARATTLGTFSVFMFNLFVLIDWIGLGYWIVFIGVIECGWFDCFYWFDCFLIGLTSWFYWGALGWDFDWFALGGGLLVLVGLINFDWFIKINQK